MGVHVTHVRSCNLCEAMCGVRIETEGDRVVSIRGDEADPFSQGYICPKATALGDIHHDPDRLRRPLKRSGTRWHEISWDEALDETAARIHQIRSEHGPHAVGMYLGNPSVHNYGALLYSVLFAKVLRSRSRFSATSVDQLPKMLTSLLLYGHQIVMSVPDVDRTDCFVIFGGNPVVSNGSLMSAPGMKRRLAAIRARGGRVIVFDPRRTETAELADEHVFVRPGSDALILAAMLHVIFAEDLVRLRHLAPALRGLDPLRASVQDFSPEAVAAASGVPAETLRRIVRSYAQSERGVLYGRLGVSTHVFGGLCNWLIEVINIVSGHFDREGGAMFPTPAVDLAQLGSWLDQQGHHNKFTSRVRGIPEFGGELPAACMAEEMDTPGDKQIRALITHAGNPVLSTPNGRRLDAALPRLDFMVAIDIYLNETTRHAHIILPPTFALEHDHYDLAFFALAVRNTVKYSPALFAKSAEQRHDWQIFAGLMTRLLAHDAKSGRAKDVALSRALRLVSDHAEGFFDPARALDLLLRIGPNGLRRGRQGLSLATLLRDENRHGIDLGPLAPCMPQRLYTRDKKLDVATPIMLADFVRLRESLVVAHETTPIRDGLLLIGRRQLHSNNSWCHNSERLVKGPDRCTLIMHPRDAAQRGIQQGERVRVSSRVGEVVAPVAVSDEVMPGVVSLPHGYGHHGQGTRLRVAKAHAGVSANDLTDELLVDPLAGTAHLSGVPVTVCRLPADVDTLRQGTP